MQNTQQINDFDRAYFIGIGGIGMSALARYFNLLGWRVAGYDKTATKLTDTLQKEGIEIHFEDLGGSIDPYFLNKEKTLVIFTPAIPSDMAELNFVRDQGMSVMKRSEVLGLITRNSKALCVAGTHGKTTTSTLLAHILDYSELKCNAFLGGISSNFNSNFVSSTTSEYTVIEADEFDRSFLRLKPFASIVTSTDADHLDIYGDDAHFMEGFIEYAQLIDPTGWMLRQANVALEHPQAISYGIDVSADYKGTNLRYTNGKFMFDLSTPSGSWKEIELGVPGIHNAENAIACVGLCQQLGIDEKTIREALISFKGVKRRFEYHVRNERLIYIDDYAHHPTEINAFISSIRLLYPDKRVVGIFQPHLFSRTRDFFDGFVDALSKLDELILMPIYPAREKPIPGITSDALGERITRIPVQVLNHEAAISYAGSLNNCVVVTIGAGDIDLIVDPLTKAFLK